MSGYDHAARRRRMLPSSPDYLAALKSLHDDPQKMPMEYGAWPLTIKAGRHLPGEMDLEEQEQPQATEGRTGTDTADAEGTAHPGERASDRPVGQDDVEDQEPDVSLSAQTARVIAAAEHLLAGALVAISDDAERENETDLVLAAEMATPEKVNFMMRQACGLVCIAITPERAARLGLHPMVRHHAADTLDRDGRHGDDDGPAFTVSVDARKTKTGISASERATTMRLLASPAAKGPDFQAPGHVFPLIARGGGVLERRGHTEAGVDLARIANVQPAVVLCELLDDEGEPMRGENVLTFCRKYAIVRCSVEDLVIYRKLADVST